MTDDDHDGVNPFRISKPALARAHARQRVRRAELKRPKPSTDEYKERRTKEKQSRAVKKPCDLCTTPFYGAPEIWICPSCALASIPAYCR